MTTTLPAAPSTDPGTSIERATVELADIGSPADVVTGSLTADRHALRALASDCEHALAALPPVPCRGATHQAVAKGLHLQARLARDRFLAVHAGAVYDELTQGRTRSLRIDEIATATADRFVGLVPSATEMAAESGREQAAKEGWEIDLGILFRRLLAAPESGRHLLDSMLAPTPRAVALLPEFRRTGRTDLGPVLLERHGAAAHLTMTNGRRLNAEDNAQVEAMETAVDLALMDDDVRVGLLRGGVMTHPRHVGRRVFCAGINLAHLHEGRISFVDFLLRRELGYIAKLYRGLLMDLQVCWPQRTIVKPWVAAVDGFAIGGGAQLLMVFDRVVAAADSYVSLPAAQEGIVPGAANMRLGRLAGGRTARQVILWGRRIHATEPDAAHLIDDVVDPTEMDAAAENALDRLDAPAVVANRHMLHMAEEPVEAFRSYMAEFAFQQSVRLYGDDVLSKVRRFNSRGSGG